MGLKKEDYIKDLESKSVNDTFELSASATSENNLLFKKPKKYETTEDEKVLKILVNDNDGDREISKSELTSYINSNKKLNKIVIEEVKVNDVKRTNLIFDQKVPSKQIDSSVDILLVEKNINKDFFLGSLGDSANVLGNDFALALNALKSRRKIESVKSPILEDQNQTENQKPKALVDDMDFSFSNLTMKDEEKSPEASTTIRPEDEDEEFELKNVKVSRHEIRRKNNKSLSKLYYRVKNHIELFKLGDSYLRDFNRGVKSLAFHSCTCSSERERTVLGVSSFLNYNAKVTVTIVTDNLKKSLYHEHIKELEEVKKTIINENISYTSFVTQGVEFIEFSELCDVMYQLGNTSFEEFIEDFIENSDVVLWDLPKLSEMDNKKELFYPVIRSIESVSIVVETNLSSYKEIISVKDYFDKYKVPFKGFVVA